jgi:hypothetical protein
VHKKSSESNFRSYSFIGVAQFDKGGRRLAECDWLAGDHTADLNIVLIKEKRHDPDKLRQIALKITPLTDDLIRIETALFVRKIRCTHQ